jgi:hypothetical protein
MPFDFRFRWLRHGQQVHSSRTCRKGIQAEAMIQ